MAIKKTDATPTMADENDVPVLAAGGKQSTKTVDRVTNEQGDSVAVAEEVASQYTQVRTVDEDGEEKVVNVARETKAGTTFTDGDDLREKDPHFGEGGVYYIDNKGNRVKAV